MKMVTNEKIFEYYKEKEEFPIVTEKFLQEYYKKENFQAYEAFYFYCCQIIEKKISQQNKVLENIEKFA